MYTDISNKKAILPPTECPTCGGELELINDQLFCTYKHCDAKLLKKMEHFAKTIKIKGLGSKTLEKLVDIGTITDIPDIYELTSDKLSEVVGEKVGNKLFLEIEKSKTIDAATLIAAFSIPLFGSTAADKLVSLGPVVLTDKLTYEQIRSTGIGDIAAKNYIKWLKEDWEARFSALPLKITFKSSTTPVKSIGTVVITGTFSEPRSVLEELLKTHGYDVKGTVTSKTTFLLAGESKTVSSKEKKAIELNIPIIRSIEVLLDQAT